MTKCIRCDNPNLTRVEHIAAVPNADPPIPKRTRWYCPVCKLTFYKVRDDNGTDSD